MVSVVNKINSYIWGSLIHSRDSQEGEQQNKNSTRRKKKSIKKLEYYTHLYVCSHDFYFDLFLVFLAFEHTRIRIRKKLSRLCLCVSICNAIRGEEKYCEVEESHAYCWWSSISCRTIANTCVHIVQALSYRMTMKWCDIVHAPHTQTRSYQPYNKNSSIKY